MKPRFPQRFGPYTLTELIARGGMAEIYRATMPGVGGFEKTVAIKKILPHLAENDEFITMLIDEARIIVSINHANIAQVYDLGKIDDDYYIAMEYIHGIDLATIVKELKEHHQTVPVEHAVFIGSCICAGLHVAHNKHDETGQPQNIVHRDVSPHNILISYAGDVKIIDFGVAKARGKDANTKMGVIKGKLLYMAPEQAMTKPIDGRADLFAAGLILYRMLTNRLPFEGENEFQIYNNIMSKEIVPPRVLNPSISEEVNQIVMMLLHRDPSKRYQDGYSAKVDLDRALQSLAPGYSVSRLSRWVEDNFSHLLERRRERRLTGAGNSGVNDSAPPTPPRPAHNTGAMRGQAVPARQFAGGEDAFAAEKTELHDPMRSPVPDAYAATAALGAVQGQPPSGNYAAPFGPSNGHHTGQHGNPSPGLGSFGPAHQTPFGSTPIPAADAAGQRAHNPSNATTGGIPVQPAGAGGQRAGVPIVPLIGILLLLLAIAGMLVVQVISNEPAEETPAVVAPVEPALAAEPTAVEEATDEVMVALEEDARVEEVVEEEEPAVPAMIALAVQSTPPGATVFLGEEELGVTPLEREIERAEEELTVRLELEGYESAKLQVTPLVDLKREVELTKIEEPKPEPPPRKKSTNRKRRTKKVQQKKKKEDPAIPLLGFEEPAAPKKKEKKEDDVLNPFDL